MNNQIIDYFQEFDELVMDYNKWLISLENPKVQKRNNYRSFLRGICSVLDIFGISFNTQTFEYNRPLYYKKDLSPKQKDAIALASDWQRVNITLDKIISENLPIRNISANDAKIGKVFVQERYNYFRNVYVSHAIK